MNAARLEKEIFIEKTKESIIQEALANCKAIIEDAFSDDINELRDEFPPGIKLKDVLIKFQSLRLNIAHNSLAVPSVEIVINMEEPDGTVFGYYMMILDKNLRSVDEHFVIE